MARSLFDREEGYPFVPPRRRVGLIDGGALRPGFAADITIFDPASIADRARSMRRGAIRRASPM
jgi:hypothetical protein